MSSRCLLAIALAAATFAGCAGDQPAAAPQQRASAPASSPSTPSDASTPSLPPLPVVPFPPARPMEVVQAVYRFANDHPEVLGQVPCFCGCENRGHRNNDDCFVTARDARGRTSAWEPHGI